MPDFKLLSHLITEKKKVVFDLFYSTMKDYINNKNANRPGMTDHELIHIENVMKNANYLDEKTHFNLGEEDYYYLILSICVHDLAMGNTDCDRKEHNKIRKILGAIVKRNETLGNWIQDNDMTIISKIVEAHSGNPREAYDKLYEDDRHDGIDLLHIAILLRIADELDITQRRIRGYTLSTLFNEFAEVPKLHWIKHKSIASWGIDNKNEHINLYFVPDILDVFIPKECPEIKTEDFIIFLKEQLLKLKSELEVVREFCRGGTKWHLKGIHVLPENEERIEKSNYIDELNEYLSTSDNTNNPEKQDSFDVKEQPDSVSVSEEENVKSSKYEIIGNENYRKLLEDRIQKKSMFRQGCYEHRSLRILSWLDSFGFHQDARLFHHSSNIIADHIKQKGVDIIIGLGLKGAKIASVVGLKTNKPVLFYFADDVSIYDDNLPKPKKAAMISDCIITGETAKKCREKLRDKRIEFENGNIFVYSVFLRNNAAESNKDNFLIQEGVKIYTICDKYAYVECHYGKKEECPLYLTNGEKQYERSYKRSREKFNH